MSSGSRLGNVQLYTERGGAAERDMERMRAGYPLVGEGGGTVEEFMTIRMGNTRTDEDARRELRDQNNEFHFRFLDDGFLDAILDMPVGFRTKTTLPRLRGVPLGLLHYKLQRRCTQRFGSDQRMGSLVLVGMFIRFKNRVDVLPGIPSTENPEVPYYPRSVSKDVDYFYFRQLPLDRVQYNWPFVGTPEESIQGGYFRGRPNVSLDQYMREFTSSEEGSDMTFFVFGHGSYIYKRFRNFRDVGYEGDNRRFETRVIRSAGLRQVLFRSFKGGVSMFQGDVTKSDYTFYCPSGLDGNCFEASLRWCYQKAEPFKYSEGYFNNIRYRYLTECSERMKTTVTEYLKRYEVNGFPTRQLRAICFAFFWITGYKVEVWYRRRRRSEWTNLVRFDSYVPSDRADITVERSTVGRICIFQCEDRGLIRDDHNRFEKSMAGEAEITQYLDDAESGELGRMMHCIGVDPAPYFFGLNANANTNKISGLRKHFEVTVNEQLKAHFDWMYSVKRYWVDITSEDVSELVLAQKSRYKSKVVNTLIFNPEKKFKKNEGDNKEAFWKTRMWKANGASPKNYVIAYDLETVTNELYLHEGEISKIYEPFRRDTAPLSDIHREILDPVEHQIPFSAQWVAVNISDRGEYLRRKTREFEKDPSLVNTITTFTAESGSENPEFFLSRAYTEKGGGLLGKCVEDMLVNIAAFVHSRGGDQAYCYAHNGAHFDAYIILQFQRFEVQSILKTSRGVMTVSLRVPITMEYGPNGEYDYKIYGRSTPKIRITLRDTMLHVPGSLARLCKGFNVPAEYCKMDFPIQRVNGSNYDHPAISGIIDKYGENDVKALGVIITRINDLIGGSPWRPANVRSLKPPITQFVTCMGMIRESTRIHFERSLPTYLHPKAVDIPALRNWLQVATIGGRVNAYAKTYTSPYAGPIMDAAIRKDIPTLRQLYSEMVHNHACTQVLDFTSLYPFAMDSCPMPTGQMKFLTQSQCEEDIQAIACAQCDIQMGLCEIHRGTYGEVSCIPRPFSIILVKNMVFTMNHKKRNMCPRKSFLTSTQKATQLCYSLESGDAYRSRREGKEEIREVQAFTNIDLYWMRRQGFVFEIIAGFGFQTSSIYNLFIGPAFKDRIKAKQEGNKLLSDFLKLNYNGSFGITTQQDITDSFFVTRIDEQYKDVDPREGEVRRAIYEAHGKAHSEGLEATEELTGEAYYMPNRQVLFQKRKKEHLGEFFADQSPMQIGAAVLSWSRHIANLVMFNIDEEEQLYTDTDSIDINDHLTVSNPYLASKICNRDDAPLGSLKNDHAENNGTEPRIFFSMIGTKKVKCHVTLNAEGKVRIFNTFKGLNVSTEVDGVTKCGDYAEYVACKTLLSLNYESTSEPVNVTSWKRDLQNGVSISNHMQNLSPDTYLEDCKGTVVVDKSFGTVEYFIPHGCAVTPHFPVYRDLAKEGVCTQGDWRKANVEEHIWKGIGSYSLIHSFIEDYYQGADSEYNPGTEDYKAILEAFARIEF